MDILVDHIPWIFSGIGVFFLGIFFNSNRKQTGNTDGKENNNIIIITIITKKRAFEFSLKNREA